MKNTQKSLRMAGIGAVVSLALAGFGVSALADAPAETPEGAAPEMTITADDVELYCGMCHFTAVENQNISTFNVETCNRAMVESMVPMLDDETIDALTAYFASIPAPEKE